MPPPADVGKGKSVVVDSPIKKKKRRAPIEEEEEEESADNQGDAPSKEMVVYSISQASTAPTGFVQRTTIAADEKFDIQGKKEVEDANQWLRQSDPYYSFGRNAHFEIPVENIIEPTATMCYQKMNK